MKDFYKFSISALIVIGIVLAVDFLAGSILDTNAYFIDCHKYNRIACADDDIAILGASRADNSYVTNIIEKELQESAYNYGVGAMNVYVNYAILNLLINKSKTKPKYVIWDFYYTDILDSPGWNLDNVTKLNTAYNYDKTIKKIIDLQDYDKTVLLKISKLYRFNSRLQGGLWRVLRQESYEKRQQNGGYNPMSVVHKGQLELRTEDRTKIDEEKLKYIDKFISMCKDNEIELFVFISPSYYLINTITCNDWSVVIEDICNNNQIPFFNYEQDSLFLSHPEWFYNTLHLNDAGAKEYTKRVVDDIKNY